MLILLGLTVIISALTGGDLSQYISTSLVSQPSLSTSTKHFTWTPGSGVSPGNYPLSVKATDSDGNVTTKTILVEVLPEEISFTGDATVDTASANEANLNWQTDSEGIPRVDYDVSPSQLRDTQESGDLTRRTTHSVALSNLLPCTTYSAQPVVAGLTIEVRGNTRTFTTPGCPGNTAAQSAIRGDITAASGGTVSLGSQATLAVPSAFAAQDATFEIHQLNRDTVLGTIGKPTGQDSAELSPVTGLYALSALQDANTTISSFDQPIQVTLAYTPAADTNVSTLALYRYDGSSWSAMDNCTVDQDNTTITCETNGFSSVAGFSTGSSSSDPTPVATPTPTPNATVTSSDNSSSGGDSGGGGGGGGGGSGGGDTSASDSSTVVVPVPAAPTNRPSPVPVYLINSYIRRILGEQFVTPDIHTYYIWRVQQRSNEPGYINSGAKLESVMRYWKAIRPNRPRGEVVTSSTPTTSSTTVTTSGTVDVSQLNEVIREELGDQFVVPDIWDYYAKRIAAPASDPAKITNRAKLESVMRYWKIVRPSRPRGD